MRTKMRAKGVKLYFDPSHSLGPKMRDEIVNETVEAMKMKIDENNYLYDGVLIEVGTAKCDTHQHITVKELQELVDRLGEFRTLVGRDLPNVGKGF
jgi:3-deoxy-D-arabino-heptulosonate 7-phosphate (DAHP) synthase